MPPAAERREILRFEYLKGISVNGNIESYEKIIGYVFKDKSLVETALTHSSYTNEHREGGGEDYERFEFLGDSILGFFTAEYLFGECRDAEGELTRMRAALVCEESLASVAEELHIGDHLRIGRGEEASGGRKRRSVRADVVEATLCAIYLDGGEEPAREFVRRFILTPERVAASSRTEDYKTVLQEFVQRDRASVLSYRLVGESGPDHSKRFESEAVVNGEVVGRGVGSSKKKAEQAAAQDACRRLGV